MPLRSSTRTCWFGAVMPPSSSSVKSVLEGEGISRCFLRLRILARQIHPVLNSIRDTFLKLNFIQLNIKHPIVTSNDFATLIKWILGCSVRPVAQGTLLQMIHCYLMNLDVDNFIFFFCILVRLVSPSLFTRVLVTVTVSSQRWIQKSWGDLHLHFDRLGLQIHLDLLTSNRLGSDVP